MRKIVYNSCYGGFGLSPAAIQLAKKLSGDNNWNPDFVSRHDKILIAVVEKLGELANTEYSKLKIESVADGTWYKIHNHDGKEKIETMHVLYGWKQAE